MLAERGAPEPEKSGLVDGIHLAGTQFFKLIEFIASLLPNWRDDPKRTSAVAEDMLSQQLCDFLNNEARNRPGIDSFQFQRETRDDAVAGRNLDIAVKPVGEWLTIGPRSYSIYDTFLPIECKRLPMPEPKRKDRDHREYLYDRHRSAGGVQRYKEGNHGRNHTIGAMIGYVQEGKSNEWHTRINGWVTELVQSGADGWSEGDALQLDQHEADSGLASLSSCHKRVGELCDIDLKHLWVEM